MTLYLSIFRQGQSTFQSILAAVGNIYENNLFMANLFEFFELKPQMSIAAQPRKLPSPLLDGVEFRGVGFRYPDNEEWVLRGIDLTHSCGRENRFGGAQRRGKNHADQTVEPALRSDRRHDLYRRHRYSRSGTGRAAADGSV